MRLIEKVARAICESVGPEGSADARSQMGDWPAWQDWVPQARVAIEALADAVSNGMVEVAEKEFLNVFAFTRAEALGFALSAAIRSAKGE